MEERRNPGGMSGGAALPLLLNLIEKEDECMAIVLRGHTYLEAILNAAIQGNLPGPSAKLDELRMSFFQKVKLAAALGVVSGEIADVLLQLNALRNCYAHRLDYIATFDEAFEIVRAAAAAGVDFSDDGIHVDKEYSKESYDRIGVLTEVCTNLFQHLVFEHEALLGLDSLG